MVAGTWIITGNSLATVGDLLAITVVLLVGVVVSGVAVTLTRGQRGPDAKRPDVERHPTLADAVSPPP